jgi:RNA recognition motif-containing protein
MVFGIGLSTFVQKNYEQLRGFFISLYRVPTIILFTFTKTPNMNIFVAGLPYDLDDAELEEIFEKFGKVNSAKVAMDRETGKSKGFGFVEMPNDEEAREAIEGLNDMSLGKKPLVVKQAEDRQGGAGNRGGGGFRGGNNRGGGGGGFNRYRDNDDRRRY